MLLVFLRNTVYSQKWLLKSGLVMLLTTSFCYINLISQALMFSHESFVSASTTRKTQGAHFQPQECETVWVLMLGHKNQITISVQAHPKSSTQIVTTSLAVSSVKSNYSLSRHQDEGSEPPVLSSLSVAAMSWAGITLLIRFLIATGST